MNTAHKQTIPTLLPPGQVQTELGAQSSQALRPNQLLGCTHCAENAIWILRKLWDWNIQDSWQTGYHSLGAHTKVFKGSLAAELKLV